MTRFNCRCCLLLFCLTGFGARAGDPVIEVTVPIPPEKDNSIFEENDNSNGAGEWLFSGLTALGDDRRALLQFDIAGRIPAGATITAVTLHLFMDRTVSGAFDFQLHRLTEEWGEANSDAPDQEGKGTAPQTGDATWNFSKFDTDGWTAGGDFSGTISAMTSVDQGGDYEWSSAQMAQDVQEWLDGTVDNFGWILLSATPDSITAKRFVSRESATASHRPSLMVTYTSDSPPAFQPDGQIQGKRGPRKGDDVINPTGAGQSVAVRNRRKFDHRFFVENDGNVADDFQVRGTRGNRFFRAKVFLLDPDGRKNITAAFHRGGFRVDGINPQSLVQIQIRTKPTRKAKGKSKRRQFSYDADSVSDPGQRDRVRYKAILLKK